MFFTVSYDYSYRCPVAGWRTLKDNLVGRDGNTPVGYGPVGPAGIFHADEIGSVWSALADQIPTASITLHLHPARGE